MENMLPHVNIVVNGEATEEWGSIETIRAVLLQNDVVVAKAKEYGIDINATLHYVDVSPKTPEDVKWLEEHDEICEDSIYPENLPDLVLIAQNVTGNSFVVGDVYMGVLQGIPILAHVWDYTGLALYANTQTVSGEGN